MRFQGFREKFRILFDLLRYSMKRRQGMQYHKNAFMENEELRDNLTLSKHVALIYISNGSEELKYCLRWSLPEDITSKTYHVNPSPMSYLL